MRLKFKQLHPEAKLPRYAYGDGDAALDIFAVAGPTYETRYVEYKTGLAVEIPYGYVGLLFPRSSITNKDLMLKNSVGVLDPSFSGEFTFRFNEVDPGYDRYEKGDRIGQLLIVASPRLEPEFVDELGNIGARGTGAYGSSGK